MDDWDSKDEDTSPLGIHEKQKKLDRRVNIFDKKIDLFMRRMSTEKSKEIKEKTIKLAKDTPITIKTWDELGDEYSEKIIYSNPFNTIMSSIIKHPVWISTAVVLFCLIFGVWGVVGNPMDDDFDPEDPKLRQQMRGDFEVYLPQDHPTKDVLDRIKEDWTVDLAIVYVETQNRFDDTEHTNITDIEVLREMSHIEDTLNPDRADRGKNDSIIFIFSIASVIKTINATPEQVKDAIKIETEIDFDAQVIQTNYSLPDAATVNRIMEQIPPASLNSLVQDTSGDGIYDTSIMLIGLDPDSDKEEIIDKMLTPGRKINDDPKVPGLIDDFYVDPNPEGGIFSVFQEESYYTEEAWLDRKEDGTVHCRMSLTGPTPLTIAITDRMYAELTWVTPVALAGVLAALFFFHRTLKILIIALVPIICTILLTFGILVLLGANVEMVVLTPQVTMIAPMIIALGVAYGLYIANRYSEESEITDKSERIRFAVQTTGTAVFLSALTTAIGFASLMLVDMLPLRVLGIGLSMGILISWGMTMLLVPSLVLALNYKKKSKTQEAAKWLGEVPVNHRKKILLVASLFTIVSIVALVNVEANMDVMTMAPDDESVVLSMRAYSENFGGGQMGMLYVQGQPVDFEENGKTSWVKDSLRDFDMIKMMEGLENNIRADKETYSTPLCVVDVMKMIKVPDFTNSTYWQLFLDYIDREMGPGIIAETVNETAQGLVGMSFFDAAQGADPAVQLPIIDESARQFLVNVFYNSLSVELRGMLVNEDYSRGLMYIDMPHMDLVKTGRAIDKVNNYSNRYPDLHASKITGFGAVIVVINEMLLQLAMMSTVIALAFVLGVLWLIFRSIKLAIFTLIPVVLVVVWQYSVLRGLMYTGVGISMFQGVEDPWGMPYFSGSLNLFTATIGSIITGIGIDFGIHITQRVREKGMSREGVAYAVSTSGLSFIESTTTMICGLVPMMLIPIPIIKEFVILVTVLLIFSAAGAILVLPAIYTLYFDMEARRKAREELMAAQEAD
jgi:predicted RND superfamily exporter protein